QAWAKGWSMNPTLIVHGGAGDWPAELVESAVAGCARAADTGWAVRAAGGPALDAVDAAVAALEGDPCLTAGRGPALAADGTVEMDASIMDGATRAGGVAAVRTLRNTVRAARAVLADGRHVLLAGAGAEAFARRAGLACVPPETFVI